MGLRDCRGFVGGVSVAAVVRYLTSLHSEGSVSWPKKKILASFGLSWVFFCGNGDSLYYLISSIESGTSVGGNFCFSTETILCNQGRGIAFILEDRTKDTCLL